MKDVIERIISTDKKSRESVAQAKRLRIESEQKINDMRERKRKEYLEKARAKIKVMEREERFKAEARLKEIENSYAKMSERIDVIYEKNREVWVDALVKRVIGEE